MTGPEVAKSIISYVKQKTGIEIHDAYIINGMLKVDMSVHSESFDLCSPTLLDDVCNRVIIWKKLEGLLNKLTKESGCRLRFQDCYGCILVIENTAYMIDINDPLLEARVRSILHSKWQHNI